MSAARGDEVELLVCTTCRRDAPDGAEAARPGAVLHDALMSHGLPENVRLKPVECLSNCAAGCTIVLRGPGRWTYVYGNLDASLVTVVAEGAARYRDAADGLVPWRERPEHFRRNCIARIPPLEAPE
ncbi:DUF1636 family protein [Rhodovulum euryhalinum]|uniref:Putative metal-binding protein n=1 Tax=Rhodovulum euryhalinum TaxID=35805 RepID=A0A4R2KL61_9RHOB|nr:DUF1636 domain-containing protein [Rhodovulum euryhalinum]TCO74114.1 putative metal-binding protein [Rhodovulum euryhalinum]